jgi:hypothetical protein
MGTQIPQITGNVFQRLMSRRRPDADSDDQILTPDKIMEMMHRSIRDPEE